MSNKITSIDNERLKHINYVMDDLYSRLAEVYESLVDKDFRDCKNKIASLSKELKKLSDSMSNDI